MVVFELMLLGFFRVSDAPSLWLLKQRLHFLVFRILFNSQTLFELGLPFVAQTE